MMALLRLIESCFRAVAVTNRSDSIMRFFFFLIILFFIFFFLPLSFLVLFNCYCWLLTGIKATSTRHFNLAPKWQLLIIHCFFFFCGCCCLLSSQMIQYLNKTIWTFKTRQLMHWYLIFFLLLHLFFYKCNRIGFWMNVSKFFFSGMQLFEFLNLIVLIFQHAFQLSGDSLFTNNFSDVTRHFWATVATRTNERRRKLVPFKLKLTWLKI